MRLKVKISPAMGLSKSPLGSVEDRLVRMPQKLRADFDLDTGLFLDMKDKEGKVMPLKISKCYLEDAVGDENAVYISEETHGLLDLEKIPSLKPADDILIGCDPEFFIINKATGHTKSASHFFPHYGEVGSDCGLAELRPRPSSKEKEVVDNIDALMRKAYKHISNRSLFRDIPLSMMAASHLDGKAAGFHIHFGLPQPLLGTDSESKMLLGHITHMLDYYIGMSSILSEGSEDWKRRSAGFSKYGRPGDHRSKGMTLEYRVPGGHLLRHPVLTSGILSLSTVVMKDILSRLRAYSNGFKEKIVFKDYRDLRKIYPNLPNNEVILKCITSEKLDNAVNRMDTLMKDITDMVGYRENSESIVNYFSYILDYLTKGDRFSKDLEINWRLAHEEQQGKMAVLQSSV